jgi:hypothetical protein
LSEEEQERVEEGYFNDREFSELLLVVEDRLIDDYVNGKLSPREQQSFESYFLRSPGRSERVEFARTWSAFLTKSKKQTSPGKADFFQIKKSLVWLPLAAMLLLVAGVGWLALQNIRLQNRLESIERGQARTDKAKQALEQQIAAEQARNQQLASELEQARNQIDAEKPVNIERNSSSIIAFVLAAGVSRDAGELQKLVIPPTAEQVRLQFGFKADGYKSYSVILNTAEGKQVWNREGLKVASRALNKTLALDLPARLFGNQDYILTLNGISPTGEVEAISEYPFRAVKK